MMKHTKNNQKKKATKREVNNTTTEEIAHSKTSTSSRMNGFPQRLLLEDDKLNSKLQYQQPIVLLENNIWVIHNFFTSTECTEWINYFENEMNIEYISHKATKRIANRECYRCYQNDPIMSQRIFNRIINSTNLLRVSSSSSTSSVQEDILNNSTSFLPQFTNEKPTSCNPNIRIYKYTKGMSFGQHIDESNIIDGVGWTRFTVLIYLSSCVGGATRFENNTASFVPLEGSILLHIHGNDCLLHEADPVQSGVKYVLRTDLVYKRI